MTENIEKYIKEYYNLNVENLIKSKLPNFLKIKILEELLKEFHNDIFVKVRLNKEERDEMEFNINYVIKKQKDLSFFSKRRIKKLLLEKSR